MKKGMTWRMTIKGGGRTLGNEKWLKSWRTDRRWRKKRRTQGGSWDRWWCLFEEEEKVKDELRLGMLRLCCTTLIRRNTGNAGKGVRLTNRKRSLSGGTASEHQQRCAAVGVTANQGLWTSSQAGGASLTARLPLSAPPVTQISSCGLAVPPPQPHPFLPPLPPA